jgi:hypothetical protein
VSVAWTGNYITYDAALYDLGNNYNKFIIVNPEIDPGVIKNIKYVPNAIACVVWYYKGTWVAKAFTKGWTREYSYVNVEIEIPNLPANFDVVFISYNESNAEENWQKVLKKAPYAKRVSNVKGIFEAHLAAAELAATDMFYVVDGDAHLLDSWEFNFHPNVLNRNAVHVWHSENPINGLQYGYGGVKLFPKSSFNNLENTSPLDITLHIAKRLVVVEKISNITAFNTDAFSTWKSAVRECTKLNLKTDKDSTFRLATWSSIGADKPFGEYAIAGAAWAKNLVDQGADLIKVNDREWLQSKFNEIY